MMLTGGGALLRDLDRLLAEETGLPVLVAEDPLTCVVRGCGMALERMERLGSIFTSEWNGAHAARSLAARGRAVRLGAARDRGRVPLRLRMALGTLDRTPPPFFRQGPSALTKLCFCSALARLPDGRRRALSPDPADPRHRRDHALSAAAGAARCRSRRSPGARTWSAGLAQRHCRRGQRRARALARQSGAGDARRPAAAGGTAGCAPCSSCVPASSVRSPSGRAASTRLPTPIRARSIIDRGVDPQRRPRLAGDQRRRRARSGDAGLPAVVEVTLLTDQRRRDSGAEQAQRRAQRRIRQRARRLGAAWRCASWRATPTCQVGRRAHDLGRRRHLSRRACRWPRSQSVDRKVDSGLRAHRRSTPALARRRAPRADPRADRGAAAARPARRRRPSGAAPSAEGRRPATGGGAT